MLTGEMSIKLKLRFAFRNYFSRNLKFTFCVYLDYTRYFHAALLFFGCTAVRKPL